MKKFVALNGSEVTIIQAIDLADATDELFSSTKGKLNADFIVREVTNIKMSLKEAKRYIKEYCKYNCEVSSWVVEGVISSKEAINLTDKDTIIELAEDLQYQVRCNF